MLWDTLVHRCRGARRGRVSLKDMHTEGNSRRHTHLVIAHADTARLETTQPTLLPAPVRGVMSNAKAGRRGGPGKPGCRRG